MCISENLSKWCWCILLGGITGPMLFNYQLTMNCLEMLIYCCTVSLSNLNSYQLNIIKQIFIEYLPCARHHSRHRGYSSEQGSQKSLLSRKGKTNNKHATLDCVKCYEEQRRIVDSRRVGFILCSVSGLTSLIWWHLDRNLKGLNSGYMGRAFQAEGKASTQPWGGNALGKFKEQLISEKAIAAGQLKDYGAFSQGNEVWDGGREEWLTADVFWRKNQ